jgi:hypothetical protein
MTATVSMRRLQKPQVASIPGTYLDHASGYARQPGFEHARSRIPLGQDFAERHIAVQQEVAEGTEGCALDQRIHLFDRGFALRFEHQTDQRRRAIRQDDRRSFIEAVLERRQYALHMLRDTGEGRRGAVAGDARRVHDGDDAARNAQRVVQHACDGRNAVRGAVRPVHAAV